MISMISGFLTFVVIYNNMANLSNISNIQVTRDGNCSCNSSSSTRYDALQYVPVGAPMCDSYGQCQEYYSNSNSSSSITSISHVVIRTNLWRPICCVFCGVRTHTMSQPCDQSDGTTHLLQRAAVLSALIISLKLMQSRGCWTKNSHENHHCWMLQRTIYTFYFIFRNAFNERCEEDKHIFNM